MKWIKFVEDNPVGGFYKQNDEPSSSAEPEISVFHSHAGSVNISRRIQLVFIEISFIKLKL